MLYRAFFLDEDDHIFAFHLMECLDDSDAIAQAQDLPAKCSTIEVWEGARLIGRTIRPRRTGVTAQIPARFPPPAMPAKSATSRLTYWSPLLCWSCKLTTENERRALLTQSIRPSIRQTR